MFVSQRSDRQHGTAKVGDQRKVFQIDRDRLVYSTAFRRLAQVTQVVSASEGNVFHNRLTHSLKVAQVARRTAEKLISDAEITDSSLLARCGYLDPDVVETAALAHDLGHPPFGHIAEKELDKVAKQSGLDDGFEGNAQTFRILTWLEPHRSDYEGLNLTKATLDATLKYPWYRHRASGDNNSHKKSRKFSVYDLDKAAFEWLRTRQCDGKQSEQLTLEASVMEFADDVTYSVHDLEDFYLAGLIPLDVIAKSQDEFEKFIEEWKKDLKEKDAKEKQLAELIGTPQEKERLKTLLEYYVPPRYNPGSIEQTAHIRRISSDLIQKYLQSVSIQEEYGENGFLRRDLEKDVELKFLQRMVWKFVILNPRLATQQCGQRRIIKTLFEIYREAIESGQVDLLPTRFVKDRSLEWLSKSENLRLQKVRLAVDIVASMSETEAVLMFRRLTGIEQGSVMDHIT